MFSWLQQTLSGFSAICHTVLGKLCQIFWLKCDPLVQDTCRCVQKKLSFISGWERCSLWSVFKIKWRDIRRINTKRSPCSIENVGTKLLHGLLFLCYASWCGRYIYGPRNSRDRTPRTNERDISSRNFCARISGAKKTYWRHKKQWVCLSCFGIAHVFNAEVTISCTRWNKPRKAQPQS